MRIILKKLCPLCLMTYNNITPDILLTFKSHAECLMAPDEINHLLKKQNKKNKNDKNHLKKSKISQGDKIIQMLNKLTNDTYNEIVKETLQKIYFDNMLSLDRLTEIVYKRLISEPSNMIVYLNFYFDIIGAYQHHFNTELTYEYLLLLTEAKFKYDFTSNDNTFSSIIEKIIKLPDDLVAEEIDNYQLQYKLNNLTLISTLINKKILSKNLLDDITDIMLSSKDDQMIYHWAKLLDKESFTKYEEIISTLLPTFSPRIRILFDEFMKKDKVPKTIPIIHKENIISSSKIDNEYIMNLIEEYLYIKEIEGIVDYINNNCNDISLKNLVCSKIIEKYFFASIDEGKLLLSLFDELLSNKILFKSNLSKGLIVLYKQKWDELSIEINRPDKKMISLLQFMIKNKITNGLEALIDTFIKKHKNITNTAR